MGYFNRDSNNRSGRDNRGGGRGFGGGRDAGRRNDGPREMFKTVCSNCNKDCEVPFRPTSGKPVYCSDCFETMGGRSADSGRPERPDKQSLPFQGRSRSDFGSSAPRIDNNKVQFDELNNKLDKIIELLTPAIKIPKVKKVIKKAKLVEAS